MGRNGRVVCAMSGGVDSSVATAILKKNGYDVVGVFMKFWAPPKTLNTANINPEGESLTPYGTGTKYHENICCSAAAQADARRIAGKLGIPFYALDFKKEFKEKVVDYLIEEYKKGRTPNPCVECNRWIKFRFLLNKALALKADYIATGHYARISQKGHNHPHLPKCKIKNYNSKLKIAKDRNKDQSYFLWTLTQNQLKRIMFPIGDYTKKEVRAMAKKWDLPVFEKRESQELCFIPDADINKFLKKRIGIKRGPIITTKREKVGEHEGLAYYTIGQRKGIKIGGIGPFYVVDKDFKKNALIVAQSDFSEALYKNEMMVKGVNWINRPKKFPFKCNVKIRYLTPAVPCTAYQIPQVIRRGRRATKYQIRFDKRQRAVTPGQSAVFYKGNEVLGGGVIT